MKFTIYELNLDDLGTYENAIMNTPMKTFWKNL